MVESGGRPGLAHESPCPLRIGHRIGPEHFDGHCPVEVNVDGTVHDSHAALGTGIDSVMTNGLADHEKRRRTSLNLSELQKTSLLEPEDLIVVNTTSRSGSC